MKAFTAADLEAKGYIFRDGGWHLRKKDEPQETLKPSKKRHKYGAQKVERDGEVYDSKLEGYFAGLLKQHGIAYKAKSVFVLQEGFVYMGDKVRDIKMIPDFLIPPKEGNWYVAIVDTKGMITTDWKLKLKLLKHKLINSPIQIFTPHTKEECRGVIIKLIDLINGR